MLDRDPPPRQPLILLQRCLRVATLADTTPATTIDGQKIEDRCDPVNTFVAVNVSRVRFYRVTPGNSAREHAFGLSAASPASTAVPPPGPRRRGGESRGRGGAGRSGRASPPGRGGAGGAGLGEGEDAEGRFEEEASET